MCKRATKCKARRHFGSFTFLLRVVACHYDVFGSVIWAHPTGCATRCKSRIFLSVHFSYQIRLMIDRKKEIPLEEFLCRRKNLMPKYVTMVSHLSVDELASRYRKAADPVERSHFQIIWLLAQGKRVREVSEATGYCSNWIRILARRYNQDGPQALAVQRQYNPGATPLLSQEQQNQLQQALAGMPPEGGLWTSRKVAFWMSEQIKRQVYPQRGWDYLQRLGLSLQAPRPRHYKADPAQQEAFKRELPTQAQRIQKIHPQAKVELWSMDEHLGHAGIWSTV
jgi:transposase